MAAKAGAHTQPLPGPAMQLPNGMALHAHQQRVVDRMLQLAEQRGARRPGSLKGLLVCHSMGSGKTITALAAARALLDAGAVDKICVVASKTLQVGVGGMVAQHVSHTSQAYYGTYYGP